MSAYAHAEHVIRDFFKEENRGSLLAGGALVALSGGKDSVLLLSLFSDYAKEKGIPFSALHLHHGIRGESADADAAFCKALCERLGVPLRVVYADVPALAKAGKEGIEETARRVRYEVLCAECAARGYGAVLTAHTASDLAETVLLSLFRGGGTRALCGIPPVRRVGEIRVLRPLLALYKDEVVAALAERSLAFCEDESNGDTRYRRNLVRHELLPLLEGLTPAPERALARLAQNARCDEDYLAGVAKAALCDASDRDGRLSVAALRALHPAILHRLVRALYEERHASLPLPERVHTEALVAALNGEGDFALSFPGGVRVRAERGWLYFLREEPTPLAPKTLAVGANLLSDGSLFFLLEKTTPSLPEIVYTLSIRGALSSVKIEGKLSVRAKRDGDGYAYGGMTHKLKKLYSDRKLSQTEKLRLPVLTDEKGILWVPSFGVRDDGVQNENAPEVLYLPRERLSDEAYEQLLTALFKT